MPILQRCWTPFQVFSWTNVKYGSYYTAGYTIVLHVVTLCFGIYFLSSDREWIFASDFEVGKLGTYYAGVITTVFSLVFLFVTGILILALKTERRNFFIPWMFAMSLEIFIFLALGLWLISKYYTNLYSVFAAIFLWCLDGLHMYCFLCVLSQYQVLRDVQQPQFVMLHP